MEWVKKINFHNSIWDMGVDLICNFCRDDNNIKTRISYNIEFYRGVELSRVYKKNEMRVKWEFKYKFLCISRWSRRRRHELIPHRNSKNWTLLLLINLRLWGGKILIFHSNWIFISTATQTIKINATIPANFVSKKWKKGMSWVRNLNFHIRKKRNNFVSLFSL